MAKYDVRIKFTGDGGPSMFTVNVNVRGMETWASAGGLSSLNMTGKWNGSDLIGQGGSLYSTSNGPVFRLNNFKPFGLEEIKVGTQRAKGEGRFVSRPTGVMDDDLDWEVIKVY